MLAQRLLTAAVGIPIILVNGRVLDRKALDSLLVDAENDVKNK